MAYKSKLGPTLHVRTCRVTVPDLKNCWTDCAQIWYTVRDRLVGCRAQVIGGTPAQFRTYKAHYLTPSVGRPKRRYTGRVDLLSEGRYPSAVQAESIQTQVVGRQ